MRALPKGPARSPETPLRPVPESPARTALPQRPQGPLAICPWPESRNRPQPPFPRPGRGRAPPDLVDAVPARSPRPERPALAAGRADRNGGHPPRVSPLAGPLSLSRVGRAGRTGQERSSRCLVRLGGVRPAVCQGNPLTPAGLPRIGPGRHRLHPTAPSRPSPCGVAPPLLSAPSPRGSFPLKPPSLASLASPGKRIHGHLAAEPCRAVGEPMARRGQGAACGLTRRPRWNAPVSLEQRGPPPLRPQAVRGQPEELAAGRVGRPADPLLFLPRGPRGVGKDRAPREALGQTLASRRCR